MIKTITSAFVLILTVLDLQAATVSSTNGNLSVEVLPGGSYSVMVKEPKWTLQGKLPSPAADIAVGQAQDLIGFNKEISFTYLEAGHPVHAVTVNIYLCRARNAPGQAHRGKISPSSISSRRAARCALETISFFPLPLPPEMHTGVRHAPGKLSRSRPPIELSDCLPGHVMSSRDGNCL